MATIIRCVTAGGITEMTVKVSNTASVAVLADGKSEPVMALVPASYRFHKKAITDATLALAAHNHSQHQYPCT